MLVEQIFETVQTINRQGVTILLVEQNAAMALSIAGRGYVLETGGIALQGPAAELAGNPGSAPRLSGRGLNRDPDGEHTMRTHGLTFEEHHVGARYDTLARTVSEADICAFVNLCGFNEPLFLDMEYVARSRCSRAARRRAPSPSRCRKGSSCRPG